MTDHLDDANVRAAAFAWLEQQVGSKGDVLPRTLLLEGFQYQGQRVPLMSRQGIFKPRVLPKVALSITTTLSGPYSDSFDERGFIRYSYRGTDPRHSENVGLRLAFRDQIPLAYFHAIIPGRYLAVWPVFIVGDDPQSLVFTVAVDDPSHLRSLREAGRIGVVRGADPPDDGRRAYITASIRQRLHQRGFRERVLLAYQDQCALCRLRHRELLDAAHIVPDSDPEGEPRTTNGLSLCKLHHAAFDGFFLGIRPDYVVEVRRDVLEERDGPMLLHGLQGLHEKRIILPRSRRDRPDPGLLEKRYDSFRAAWAGR